MPTIGVCHKCSAEMPIDAPHGLCSRCLILDAPGITEHPVNEVSESAELSTVWMLPVNGSTAACNQIADLSHIESARLEISESEFPPETATTRNIGSVVLLGLSVALFWWVFRYGALFDSTREGSVPSVAGIAVFIALLMLIIGFLLPKTKIKFIDIQQRQVVEEKWYFFFNYFHQETPLSSFSRIVVHHVCHPGGEGEDTFTGSVGLKPTEPGKIFWVKEFPATKDEMPLEPDKFAKELASLTGLPYFGNAAQPTRSEDDRLSPRRLIER